MLPSKPSKTTSHLMKRFRDRCDYIAQSNKRAWFTSYLHHHLRSTTITSTPRAITTTTTSAITATKVCAPRLVLLLKIQAVDSPYRTRYYIRGRRAAVAAVVGCGRSRGRRAGVGRKRKVAPPISESDSDSDMDQNDLDHNHDQEKFSDSDSDSSFTTSIFSNEKRRS
ncbi:hypothetical protein BGZ47_008178 [Haplosporangium gracile]|nr:hypothetical protein BGZ47_008178 [Haplosporangium gracile]